MGAFSGEEHFRTRETPAAPAAPQTAAAPKASAPPPPQSSADPNAPAPGGFDLGQFHFGLTNRGTPGVSYPPPGGNFWSVFGPGWGPGSQGEHNIVDRFTNNVLKNAADPITSAVGGGDLVTLRAQRQKMDAQMPPAQKAIADIGAQFTPPDMLLNRFGGPIVQGVVDRGLSSFNQGNDWSTIGADARTGAETGVAAKILGGVKPSSVAPIVRYGIEKAPAGIGYKVGGDFGTGWMADKFSENFVKPFAEKAGNVISSIPDPPPWLKQAIQQVIIGGQPAAAQTDAGQNLGNLAASPNWGNAQTALQNLRAMLPY
jgi:hypothetical protein